MSSSVISVAGGPVHAGAGAVAAPNSSLVRPFAGAFAPLSGQRIARDVILLSGLFLLNKGGDLGAAAFFVILTAMVLKSPRAAFQALAICSVGLMINTAFVPKSLVWTPARLALPLLAFVRFSIDLALLGTTLFASRTYVLFLVYTIVMAVCSVLSGWYLEIALIKLANFWVVTSAILAGVTVLRQRRIDLTEWFVSLIATTALFGVLALLLGVGTRFRGGNMFIGAFLHPNCHAMYASMFVVLLAAVYLCGDYPKRRLALPLTGIWILFAIWSQSRASVAATIMGLVVLFVFARPFRNRFGWRLRVNVPRWRLFAYGMCGLVLLGVLNAGTGGGISKSVVGFINKRGNADATTIDAEAVLASRQGLINESWANFQERPWTGLGFQVSKNEAFTKTATIFTAPTEKGFIVTAVLEEGGIIGATAFLIFLASLIFDFLSSRNVPALAMLACMLTANMAEVTLFSPGGTGAFTWIMLGAAMILGDHCWRRDRHAVGSRAGFGSP